MIRERGGGGKFSPEHITTSIILFRLIHIHIQSFRTLLIGCAQFRSGLTARRRTLFPARAVPFFPPQDNVQSNHNS